MDFFSLIGGLPRWLIGKESAGNAGDMGSVPGSGRSLGGGHGNPLQYSRLENPTDRGAWWATVHVVKSWTRLSTVQLARVLVPASGIELSALCSGSIKS